METRANYVTVGLFTLIVLAAAFAFIYWTARLDEQAGLVPLNVRIQGSVTGLGEGSDVLFNGIKVGKVARVQFDAEDPRIVYAITGVKADTPLRADSQASVGSQGLTGISYISLKGGTPEAPAILGGEETPVIDAAPSAVGDILETVRDIAGRADRTMASLDQFIRENREPATRAVANVEEFSKALARNAEGVDKFLASVSVAAESLQTLSAKLDGTIVQTERILNAVDPEKVRSTVANIEDFTAELKGTSDGIKEVVAAAQVSIRQIETFTKGMNETLVSLDGIVKAVDPETVSTAVADLAATSKDARSVASAVAGRRGEIDGIITNASELVSRLNEASTRIDGVMAKLDGFLGSASGGGLADDVKATLAEFRATSETLRVRVNEISAGLGKFSDRGLDDVRALVQDTRRSISQIERAVTDFQQNPQQIITGGGARPREFDGGRPRR